MLTLVLPGSHLTTGNGPVCVWKNFVAFRSRRFSHFGAFAGSGRGLNTGGSLVAFAAGDFKPGDFAAGDFAGESWDVFELSADVGSALAIGARPNNADPAIRTAATVDRDAFTSGLSSTPHL